MGSEIEDHLADVRRRLIRLVKQKSKQRIDSSKARPTRWNPGEVRCEGIGLSNVAAWDTILFFLESGEPLTTLVMDKPPGTTGYIMKPIYHGQKLYIKLEIGAGDRCVYGRSFHISEH